MSERSTIKKYAKPSKIVFDVQPTPPGFTLGMATIGQTFLREGAVCMRVECSAYKALESMREGAKGIDFAIGDTKAADKLFNMLKDALKSAPFICNLQTGRVWVANPDDQIEWVKVRMTLDGAS